MPRPRDSSRLRAGLAHCGVQGVEVGQGTDSCCILKGFTCFLRVIKESRWHNGILRGLAKPRARVEPCAPDGHHVEHSKEYAVEARQDVGILGDLVDRRQPLDEEVLGGGRGLAFALAKRGDDGDNNVAGYSLGRIQVLD